MDLLILITGNDKVSLLDNGYDILVGNESVSASAFLDNINMRRFLRSMYIRDFLFFFTGTKHLTKLN